MTPSAYNQADTYVTGSPTRLGIDIGVTKIEALALEGKHHILARRRIPTRRGNDRIVQDVLHLVTDITHASTVKPQSLGIGIPGQVDGISGVVHSAVNLSVSELRIADIITDATGIETHVENDVNAAALGASTALDIQADPIAFINLGTGLAAGIVRQGRIDHGATGICGEIGHIAIDHHRLTCPCGQHGCLETVASGSAVQRLWPVQDKAPLPDLINQTKLGNQKAQGILDIVINGICTAIQIIALSIDPRTIIIGGGMAKTGQPLFDLIDERLHAMAYGSEFMANADLASRIVQAPLDQPLGALGAAVAA
jgi:predicted NBD/HSP70 family sugar kinase